MRARDGDGDVDGLHRDGRKPGQLGGDAGGDSGCCRVRLESLGRVVRRSSLYSTEPVGFSGAAAVCECGGGVGNGAAPRALLAGCSKLSGSLGATGRRIDEWAADTGPGHSDVWRLEGRRAGSGDSSSAIGGARLRAGPTERDCTAGSGCAEREHRGRIVAESFPRSRAMKIWQCFRLRVRHGALAVAGMGRARWRGRWARRRRRQQRIRNKRGRP